jgi:hypothetical protein
MEATYGSMSAGIVGRRACKWKLLLHAVADQPASVVGCKQTKSVSVTKKSDKPAGMRSNGQSKHVDRMEQATAGRAYGANIF